MSKYVQDFLHDIPARQRKVKLLKEFRFRIFNGVFPKFEYTQAVPHHFLRHFVSIKIEIDGKSAVNSQLAAQVSYTLFLLFF